MANSGALRRARAAVVLLLVAGIYWPVGFYPFHPVPVYTNHATFDNDGILSFDGGGIAYTPVAPEWLGAAIDSGRIELTLELRPAKLDQKGATIFTISNDSQQRNLTLRQHEKLLVVQFVRSTAAGLKSKELYVPKVFRKTDWYTIRLILERGEASVYINDKLSLSRDLADDTFAVWSADYRLSLGNMNEFNRPWRGEVRQAKINAGEHHIDYIADRQLETPASYQRIHDRTLERFLIPTPMALTPTFIRDVLVNLLGFIPLGLVTALLWQSNRPIVAALVVSTFATVSIELTQVFLPWRVPSLHDIVLNIAGGLIGAGLGVLSLWLPARLRRKTQRAANPLSA